MLGLLFSFAIKTAILVASLSVTYLSLRRFLMSKSSNAWLYSAVFMLSFLTTLGLSPWLLGFGQTHPIFLLFATMLPAIWYGVVLLCNSTRAISYDSELAPVFHRIVTLANARNRNLATLVLEEPQWPDAPWPVFRHAAPETSAIPEPMVSKPTPNGSRVSDATHALLNVARSMRNHASSERRRTKLLPPPSRTGREAMPFLRAGKST
jgi:hypothetical protein